MSRPVAKKTKKRNNRILRRMQTKLWFIFGFVCILFVILLARIMYIHRTSGEKYEKIVLSQQDYDSQIIPFQRGDIYDRRGSLLATSVDVYNVILDCKVLNANPDYIGDTIDAVTRSFPGVKEDTIKDQLRDNPTGQYYVLAKKVPYEQMAAYLELKTDEA
ncbi:MAG: peptidoglycan glycosyltransferase, partial [Parasporobacterium sp.]|nr:peptidoglycan glycosyltransferase [Parasporobacterium sp.]